MFLPVYVEDHMANKDLKLDTDDLSTLVKIIVYHACTKDIKSLKPISDVAFFLLSKMFDFYANYLFTQDNAWASLKHG